MKAKNILKIKERLENHTSEIQYGDRDNTVKAVRFDAYEEAIYLSYANGTHEFIINLNEAKKLKQILNRLV